MTLTDRKIRFEIIARLESKTKDEVIKKIKKIKLIIKTNLKDIIKSISTDNGTEFSAWKEIQEILNTTVYFCHPYASYEKGTNEKHNGIIRYFIPKGNLIENYSNKNIEDIANWMNNYPRKIFGYKTPLEMLKEEINDDNLFNKIINIQKNLMLYNNIKLSNKCIFYIFACCTSFENLGVLFLRTFLGFYTYSIINLFTK